MTTDSIKYLTNSQIADFLAPVRILSDSSQIYSNDGWFNLDDEEGQFIGSAQYLKDPTIATADIIFYNKTLNHIQLSSDTIISTYISEKDTAYAKIIFYDKGNEVFRLEKNAVYYREKNKVKGEIVYYGKKNVKFLVLGKSFVSDPPLLIEFDTLEYDKSIKYGKADGYVVWRDTTAKIMIMTDHILYRGEENYQFFL